MAGAHIHYFETQGDNFDIFIKSHNKRGRKRPILSPNEEVNPLQKYADALDNPASYTPTVINATQAQYLIKALDYLKIWSQEHHDMTEQPLHEQVEEILVDIVAFGPEN